MSSLSLINRDIARGRTNVHNRKGSTMLSFTGLTLMSVENIKMLNETVVLERAKSLSRLHVLKIIPRSDFQWKLF